MVNTLSPLPPTLSPSVSLPHLPLPSLVPLPPSPSPLPPLSLPSPSPLPPLYSLPSPSLTLPSPSPLPPSPSPLPPLSLPSSSHSPLLQWNLIDSSTGLTGTHTELSALSKDHTQVFTMSMWDLHRKFR